MRAVVAAAVAGVCVGAPAEAGEHRHTLSVIVDVGKSFTIDPAVANSAPPVVGVRLGREVGARGVVEVDAGVALISFPDHVPALRVGARVFAGRLWSDHPLARAAFVRAGVQALVSTGGFDAAAIAELGIAPERDRVFAYLAASAGYYIVDPRALVGGRAGVGFRF